MKRLIVTAALFCLAALTSKADDINDYERLERISIEFQKEMISKDGQVLNIQNLNDQEKRNAVQEDYHDFRKFFSEFQRSLLIYEGEYNNSVKDYIANHLVQEYKNRAGAGEYIFQEYASIFSLIQKDYKKICELSLLNDYNYNIRNYPETWSLSYEPKIEKYDGRVYMLRYHNKANDETVLVFSKNNNTDGDWKIIDLYQQEIFSSINNHYSVESCPTICLNKVFFKFNKAELLPESYPELKRLVKKLKGNPSITIKLLGHTDNVGPEDFNIKLSKDRADAVKNYMVSLGINKNRITTKGYGSSNPVASNGTNEGRALNRRVEYQLSNR